MSFDIDGRERPNQGIVLSRKRTSQPQSAVGLTAEFARPQPAVVFNAANGFESASGVGTSLAVINPAYTGPRFQPVGSQMGMRLYADQGGNNDDILGALSPIATALAGPMTTVLLIHPKKYGSTSAQWWLGNKTAGSTQPYGHHLSFNESNDEVRIGYDGDNGYTVISTLTLAVPPWDRDVCVVISTVPVLSLLVMSIDGQTVVNNSGSPLWYIGGGNKGLSVLASLGNGSYPNYYLPNGYVSLWAALPGVSLSQSRSNEVTKNPWQLFAPIKSNALSLTPKRQVWTPRQTRLLGTSSGSVATVAIQTSKSIVRTSQPQSAIRLARNELTRGIAFTHCGSAGFFELVTGLPIVNESGAVFAPSVTASGVGIRALSFNSGSYNTGVRSRLWTSNGSGTGDFSILLFYAPRTGASFEIPCASNAFGSGYAIATNLGTGFSSTSKVFSFLNYSTGTGVQVTNACDNKPHVFVVRRVSSSVTIWIDGVLRATATNTVNVNPASDSRDNFASDGNVSGSGYGCLDPIALHVGMNRAWSDSEIRSLAQNPWQLCAPRKQTIWTPAP
jgi:hypothetical protein